jgi:hypothetical protein
MRRIKWIPSDTRGDDHASVTSGMDEVGVGKRLNNNFIAEGRRGSQRSPRTAEELEITTPGEDIDIHRRSAVPLRSFAASAVKLLLSCSPNAANNAKTRLY